MIAIRCCGRFFLYLHKARVALTLTWTRARERVIIGVVSMWLRVRVYVRHASEFVQGDALHM